MPRASLPNASSLRIPEGGYYANCFGVRSAWATANRERSAPTVIEFLLADDGVSTWHRLASDETWHFVSGCVAPGFESEDFELISQAELAIAYSDRLELLAAYAPRART